MKALSPIAVLISALLLQGCVAAAVMGTAAVGTKAATDPRSVGTQVDDGTLEVRVNSALSKDEQIKKEARINVTAYQGKVLLRSQLLTSDLVKSSNVKVTTENGEVFLMGLVTEREAKAAADIASRVSGVKRVTTAFTFIK